MSFVPRSILEHSASMYVAPRGGPEGPLEYLLLLVTVVVGAFAEELVMRGYLIARLERLLKSTIVAVLISTALFASYHLYQGAQGAIGAGATGLVYAAAFCLSRRLWPICFAHALHNFVLCL
jgi:membrane protease YdiL (CAAX protease family)